MLDAYAIACFKGESALADDIEYITFDNDELGANIQGTTPQQTAYINGTIEVDYTTDSVSGSYSISGDTSAKVQFTDGGGLSSSNNTYQFSTGGPSGISVSYDGTSPSQADLIVYDTDPGQPSNTEYSSTDEPTPLLTSSAAPPPCFATGTAILTARGPFEVEHLAVGDMALTTSGRYSRVRWIGHRTVDCRRNLRPLEVMPVRIFAHAFGPNVPSRDLRVSPGHAICIDVGGEVLIPAGALTNGISVVQEDVEAVTYWHVELESHDVLFAENLPCESYLDMGNRGFFAESGVVDLAGSPDASVRTHADFCRPYHAGGAIVEAVRCRLATRAAEDGGGDRAVRDAA